MSDEKPSNNEAQILIKLQGWLNGINDSSLHSTTQAIINSVFVTSESKIQQLIDNIVHYISLRSKQYNTYLQFIRKLYNSQGRNNFLCRFKDMLLTTLLKPKPFIDFFLSNTCNFMFLRHITSFLGYTDNEIVGKIKSLCGCYSELRNYKCLLFCYFAPELEAADPSLFQTLYQSLEHECSTNSYNVILRKFLDAYNTLRSENWKFHKDLLRIGSGPNIMVIAIKTDNITLFQDISVHPHFDVDSRISPSIFEPYPFLHNEPTLIQYAAFHGSLKVFKFLMMSGANLKKTDNSKDHRTLAHFVVAGGNTEIIRICENQQCDLSNCLQIATMFHRFDVFNWLHFTYFPDLNEVDPDFGSVLHEAAASNNIKILLYCIENKVDINIRSVDQQTPLHYAVKNSRYDALKILLSFPEADVNARDSSGMSPLHHAALFDDPCIAKCLLHCSRVDVNIRDNNGVTPLHLSTQDGNYHVVDLLLKQSGIEVNCKDHTPLKFSPLHYAVEERHEGIVKLLLSHPSIDTNEVNANNETPLSLSTKYGFDEISALFQGSG